MFLLNFTSVSVGFEKKSGWFQLVPPFSMHHI